MVSFELQFTRMFKWFQKQEEPVEPSSFCPYCKAELVTPPTRKKKCQYCGQTFLVRTHYKTGERLVLTEDQVSVYDKEREQYYRVKYFIDSFKNAIGIDASLIEKLSQKTEKELTERFGKPPVYADLAWGISNRLITERPQDAGSIHFQQALFLHESGKDYFYIRVRDMENEIKRYEKLGVKFVEIITCKDLSCPECRILEDKRLSIQDALEQKLLPCRKCSNKSNPNAPTGWCRCTYVPLMD